MAVLFFGRDIITCLQGQPLSKIFQGNLKRNLTVQKNTRHLTIINPNDRRLRARPYTHELHADT